MDSSTPTKPPEGLATQVELVLADFRTALGRLFDALGEIRRPTDLQRRLDLDPALAWGVYRAATVPSVLQSGLHVPGNGSMKTFIRSASSAGLDGALVSAVETAFVRFDTIRESNGGLQNGFTTLLGDLADTEDPRESLRQQRAAFRANGHIWGLQAAAIVNLKLLVPGSEAGIDLVSVQGLHHLRKLRRAVTFRARLNAWARTGSDTPSGEPGEPPTEPLVLDSTDEPAYRNTGLLVDFCSRPLPELELGSEGSTDWSAVVRHNELGVGGATTFLMGYRQRDYYPRDWITRAIDLSTFTRIPAEFLAYDVLVHASLVPRVQGRLGLYGRRTGRPGAFIYNDEDRLPLHETALVHDRADRAPRIADLPRHTELLERVCTAVGHPIEQFRLVRAVLKYPVLNAFIRLTVGGSIAPSPGTA